jgi:hypothetical protein
MVIAKKIFKIQFYTPYKNEFYTPYFLVFLQTKS